MARTKDYIGPLVIVWKTSNRSNSPIKIKKTSNYNLDYFLQIETTIPGIPIPSSNIIASFGIPGIVASSWRK